VDCSVTAIPPGVRQLTPMVNLEAMTGPRKMMPRIQSLHPVFMTAINNGALYVDGALVANNTVVTNVPGDSLDVWIAGAPDYNNRFLPAAVADAAIFNQALTPAQIQGVYNGIPVQGPQTIIITHSGANVVLNWQSGTLLQSTNLLGPWTTNSAATSGYTIPATNRVQFFRLRVSP
jgi:hypothetical protein